MTRPREFGDGADRARGRAASHGTRRGRAGGIRIGGLALTVWSAGGLSAQENPPDTARTFRADTLLVEVLRAPVGLGNAPFSISTAGADALRAGKAGVSLEEALQAIPGIQIQNRYNYSTGERVAVRGFGARAQFGVRGVKILIDGIPATLPDGQSALDHLDLGSLGRVEALRGPGSALYGNSSGGVLSFTTAAPAETAIRPEALVVAGSDGLTRLQASASGTAGGTGYLANVSFLGYDGFRTNPVAPEGGRYSRAERLNVNGQLSWLALGGELALTLNYMDLGAENPGALSDSLLSLGDRQAFRFNVVQGSRKDVEQGQAGLAWRGPLGGLRAEVSAYGIVRSLDNPIPPSVIDLDRTAGGVRATLGSGTPPGQGRRGWLAGVDVELQRDDRLNFENDGGERGGVTLDQLERVRATGAFVQGGIRLAERVTAVAALRYDRFRFEAEDRLPDRFPGQGLEDSSGARDLEAISPSLGLAVDAGAGQSVFANVSSVFDTPTTTELANQADGSRGFNQDIDPQTGFSVEVGSRGSVRGSVGYEVAVFRTAIENELIPFEVENAPGRSFFKNAGSSRYQGFETALFGAWPVGTEGRLGGRLTYSYTSAEFRDYVVDGESLAGNEIPGQAPHRLEAIVRGEHSDFYAELRTLVMDAIATDDRNTASSDAYAVVDLRVGGRELGLGRLFVAPFVGVNNVLDSDYVASVVVNAFGGRFFEPGPTRTVYVGVSVGWPGS